MNTCPECGEKLDAQFADSCWKCANGGIEIAVSMESAGQGTRSVYQLYQQRIIISALIISALTGPPFFLIESRGSLIALVAGMFIADQILIYAWCYFDSLERDEPLPLNFRINLALLGPFALFVYLIGSRGFKESIPYLMGAALLIIGMALAMTVTGVASHIIYDFYLRA